MTNVTAIFNIGYLVSYAVTFFPYFVLCTSHSLIYYLHKCVTNYEVTPLSSEDKLFSVKSFNLILTPQLMENSFNDAVL